MEADPDSPPEPVSASNTRWTRPDDPVVRIRAGRSSLPFELREVWTHRELLYFLIWRDLKVRYRQTVVGVTWVIAQPLLTTLIFTIFLGNLARVPSDGLPYPIFAYAGILPWTFFVNSVSTSSNSLVGNAHLITKVYFPRLAIPIGAVGARLIDFAVAFVILIGLMIVYEVPVTWHLLMLPFLVALIIVLALGVGMWASALNVKYRDIGYALPVLLQLWMFASPVLYPASQVPTRWRALYALNPVTGIVEGFRSSLFGRDFDWIPLMVSSVVTIIVFSYAAHVFRRMERSFADVV